MDMSDRSLMWVPVINADTEVWAARSQDGLREYNVRREWDVQHNHTPVSLWMALWANTSDNHPNVFATKFISRWDAQNVCEELDARLVAEQIAKDEQGYRQRVAEEQRRLKALSKGDWSFQGVYAGLSVWTRMHGEACYVIINDRANRPNQYSLSIRFYKQYKGDVQKLVGTSLGVYDSLPAAQKAVARLH